MLSGALLKIKRCCLFQYPQPVEEACWLPEHVRKMELGGGATYCCVSSCSSTKRPHEAKISSEKKG